MDWGTAGAIVVVGWPGQWGATFARDDGRGLRIQAGQEQTRFKLLPGEEVRSPLMVLQFWQGDWIKGQNLWRRWMIAHNIPRLNGKLPPALMPGGSSNQMNEMQNANEENQKQFIDGYLDNGVPISYYPLTRWSAESDAWIAWQFDQPEDGKGVVQAFRRPQSLYETARFKLRGLEPLARYTLTNFDVPGTTEATGKELIEKGLLVPTSRAR